MARRKIKKKSSDPEKKSSRKEIGNEVHQMMRVGLIRRSENWHLHNLRVLLLFQQDQDLRHKAELEAATVATAVTKTAADTGSADVMATAPADAAAAILSSDAMEC